MDYVEMRPFDFMVPFWGERYRDYFVDLALPSLLAPNNLSLLRAENGHRMLIATTGEDWHAIEHLPIMQRLRQHAIPVWIEVSGPPVERDQYAATIRHQHHCLKKLFETAYERRGYGVQLYPDVVYSDGMVGSVYERARAGQHAVIGVAMRQAEEDALAHLHVKGYLQRDVRLSLTAGCMNIPQREMAAITTAHLHPEMDLYDHGKPAPPFVSPFHYWRIPKNRGIILHTFFTPMLPLIDFAVVPPNHAECLDACDIAKDYVSKNFSDWSRIGVVQDSDEWACISLTPRASNQSPAAHTATHVPRWWSQLRRLSNLRESMRAYAANDIVRRELFRLPIGWHAGDLDEVWAKEEQRIAKLIDRAAGDHSIDLVTFSDRALRTCGLACRRRMTETAELSRRLWLAASGNHAARRWVSWRVNVLWRRMQGHTTHPPRPEVP
jgi:hypothetical protein